MTEFASRWPDVRLWAINTRLRPNLPGTKVSAEREEGNRRQVVVSVVPAQLETAVSRFFFVTVEAWVLDANGNADKAAAHDLASEAAFIIESSPRDSRPVVKAELNAGPNEHRENGVYYSDAAVLVTVHRL